MSRWRTLYVLLVLALGVTAAAQTSGPLTSWAPTDGATLGGRLELERLVIPAGVTVWVESDLELVSRGDIVIEGALVARPGLRPAGTSLQLRSATSIVVHGRLAAGDGAAGLAVGVAGGRGGDLRLDAPVILSIQDLTGGAGGDGGPGAPGGDGGNVSVSGWALAPADFQGQMPALRGGHGGAGGRGTSGAQGGIGGAGGKGGTATAPASGDGVPGAPGNTGNSTVQSVPGEAGISGGPCTAGTAGGKGLMAVAGHGGNGGDGGPAISLSGTGGFGGPGGAGGLAVASRAGRGGDSGGCCFVPLAGSNGGQGGDGGHAFGGVGGDGGAGGVGGTLGVGGDGGAAGSGGSALGGQAGDGGNGGGGDPPGTPGNPGGAGHAFPGTAGLPGLAGTGGNGSGLDGATAADGTATSGNIGFSGQPGDFCLEFQTWTQTDFGLAGTGDLKPLLFGLGPLSPASNNSLSLFDLHPGSPGVIFASLTPLLAPFKGGWLIPAPDFALPIMATPNGNAFLTFNMPVMAVLPGTVIQLQAWFVDGGAINGLSATNGLRGRIP